jgi:hypothetical protein
MFLLLFLHFPSGPPFSLFKTSTKGYAVNMKDEEENGLEPAMRGPKYEYDLNRA